MAGRWSWTRTAGRASRSQAGGRRDRVTGDAAGRARRVGPARGRAQPGARTIAIAHRRRTGHARRRSRLASARPRPAARAPVPGPADARRRARRRRRRPAHLDGKLDRPGDRAGPRRRDRWPPGARRRARAARPRRRPSGPARRLRQRAAARGHRPRLARRRPRLAPGARAVRRDALPLRRGRRPRLAAQLRARVARGPSGGVYGLVLEADGVEDVVAFAVGRAPPPSRRRTPSCSRPSPTWPTRASARRPRPRARNDPRTDGWRRPGCAPLRPPCGRGRRVRGVAAAAAHPAAARATAARSTAARTASPRT